MRNKHKKTPPTGVVGGEKQYKDYEKNPMLSFTLSFDAANIGNFSICNVFPTFFPKTQKKDCTTLNLPLGGHDCEVLCIWKRVMVTVRWCNLGQHHCLAAMTN